MKDSYSFMPPNVRKYVAAGVRLINVILLLCHIGYTVLFLVYDANVLFCYSVVGFCLFVFSYVMLKKRKIWIYVVSNFIELFVFMILAVIYLGWEYGFQQYCISFVASLIFTDFYMSRQRKISRFTILLVFFNVSLYMALRIWTYQYPYVYVIGNELFPKCFFLFNSLIGFWFLIMYLCIYSSTVHRLENTLTEMANIDPLTGVANRRKMKEMLETVMKEYETQRYETVIAMVDVDFFKKVNDTYGHDVGDEVLKMLAKILRERHEKDEGFHVSRWGGEEFLIFYERHKRSKEEVVQEFDCLRQQIQDTVVLYNDIEMKITVTIGLAFYEKGDTIQKLIKEADNNLYIGKESGRNRVVS